MTETAAIILAAGQGSRMHSNLAKVLHPIGGLEMVNHAVRNVRLGDFSRVIVVIGYQGDRVKAVLSDVELVEQKEQLGTGHAVNQCAEALADFDGPVLVTYGDTPLFRGETFKELLEYHQAQKASATIVTAIFEDPSGYGRICRNEQEQVLGVVEHKDATTQERQIKEINTGTYCFDSKLLFQYLQKITPHNAQAEYYLPDVLPLMIEDGLLVAGYVLQDAQESMGINDRAQLAQAEAIMRDRQCAYWMEQGVTIMDPSSTWIEADCKIGQDTIIYPQTFIQQGTVIGSNCLIGPNCRLSQAQIGAGVTLENSIIIKQKVEEGSKLVPFTFLSN